MGVGGWSKAEVIASEVLRRDRLLQCSEGEVVRQMCQVGFWFGTVFELALAAAPEAELTWLYYLGRQLRGPLGIILILQATFGPLH